MRGLGGIYKRGPVYWIRYHHRGREYRESARSTERGDAVRLLKQRVADIAQGRPSPADEERVTFDQIAAEYIVERTLKGVPKPRLEWSPARVAHLRTFYGGMRAVGITTATMREYAKVRRAAGAEPGTVNRDLGVLSRMFTLALPAGRLSRRPYIPRLPENPAEMGGSTAEKGPMRHSAKAALMRRGCQSSSRFHTRSTKQRWSQTARPWRAEPSNAPHGRL